MDEGSMDSQPNDQLDLDQSASYLISSMDVFRETLRRDSDSALNQIHLVRFFTSVVEECRRKTRLSKEQLDRLVSEFSKALIILESTVIPSIRDSCARANSSPPCDVPHNARESMVDAMFTVSDVLFRLGNYHDAQHWYQKCMDWSQQYILHPAMNRADVSFERSEATVSAKNIQLETAVQKFEADMLLAHDTSISSAIWEENGNSDDSDSKEENLGYSGDLHVRIGLFYQNQDVDQIQSLSHLGEAIRLYALAGENEELPMAIAKYNLSVVYRGKGDFTQSASLYKEALEIFVHIFGEGNNPLNTNPDGVENDSMSHSNRRKDLPVHRVLHKEAVDTEWLFIRDKNGLELNVTMFQKTI
jgi:tetratricopeptide (TPR) repeat protein